jgi:hypothetical protein
MLVLLARRPDSAMVLYQIVWDKATPFWDKKTIYARPSTMRGSRSERAYQLHGFAEVERQLLD